MDVVRLFLGALANLRTYIQIQCKAAKDKALSYLLLNNCGITYQYTLQGHPGYCDAMGVTWKFSREGHDFQPKKLFHFLRAKGKRYENFQFLTTKLGALNTRRNRKIVHFA